MKLYLIAAVAQDGAIGQGNGLPWARLRGDLAWVRGLTTALDPLMYAEAWCQDPKWGPAKPLPAIRTNAVMMGTRTFASLPGKLPGRINIVLTRAPLPTTLILDPAEPDILVNDLAEAIDLAKHLGCPNAVVIGGAQVYEAALKCWELQYLLLTEIAGAYPQADTWFPQCEGFDWPRGEARVDYRTPATRARDGQSTSTTECWERCEQSAWQQEYEVTYRLTIWQRRLV